MLLSTVLACALQATGPQAPTPPETPPTTLHVVIQGQPGFTSALLSAGFDAEPVTGRDSRAANFEMSAVFGSDEEIDRLRRAYPGHPVVEVDRGMPFRDRLALLGNDAPDLRYHDWNEINADLLTYEQGFPAIAKRVNITQAYGAPATHEGRDIYALKISDNVDQVEDEASILVVSNHHARELNTIELALHVADQILTGYGTDPQVTQLVNDKVVWIVPTMNPDGLEYIWSTDDRWRKNRRDNFNGTYGVDLNRNYPFFWSQCGSSNSTNSGTYHGPGPASEPETMVMMAFTQAERFERVYDQHSFGRDVRWAHNPLTVGNIPTPVSTILDRIQSDMAGGMNYSTNSSCCCGGEQHWQFAENGALSYLGEMGTSFQPDWNDTVAEVARVWGGLTNFLFEPTPVTGHVVSIDGSAIEAEIRLPAAPFVDGQKRRSERRFGRYSVWLANGTYDLEFVAPGFETATVQVQVQEGQTLVQDVVMMPVLTPTTMVATGTPCVGCSVTLNVVSPDDPTRDYLIVVSHARTPEIVVGSRTLPIAPSPFLLAGTLAPTIFQGFNGQLNGAGSATATLHIPSDPALSGFGLWFAAVTLDPAWPLDVKGISNDVQLVVQ